MHTAKVKIRAACIMSVIYVEIIYHAMKHNSTPVAILVVIIPLSWTIDGMILLTFSE